MLTRRVATALAGFVGLFSLLLPSQAVADGGNIDVGNCAGKSSWICNGVTVPSKPGKGGGSNSGGGGRGGNVSTPKAKGDTCATGAKDWKGLPCSIEGVGQWDDQGCYVRLVEPQPPKSDPIWDGHTTGAIYHKRCMAQNQGMGINAGFTAWEETNPVGQTGPSAADLAQQALSKMRLDGAKVGSAPRAGSKGLVGMPVWLWTEQTPNTWGPISTTAAAGGLSVTATAQVESITWAMGDGESVTCTKPGTKYSESFGKRESPDCGHVYAKVPAGGSYKVTATSSWSVSWDATNGETGTLPNEIRDAATAINIGELQVVN